MLASICVDPLRWFSDSIINTSGAALGIARRGVPVPAPVGNLPFVTYEGGFYQNRNGLGEQRQYYHGLDAALGAQDGHSRMWSPDPASLHSFEEGESMG
jgi:hypothetical protein